MEALLPSEMARLVLGYLEDQKCIEAAKIFLETSPHLQECRTVLSLGRKFSTKVSGLTLMDIVEKFSAISTMIQERLCKVTDCEQLKHCGDLMEQLKFLVEEPRGQRFVVNINVPSQNNTQVLNGSPIITSSSRKRRHSNSERIKRSIKSQLNTLSLPNAIMSTPNCDNVDTTPLESLPGNADPLKQVEADINVVENKDNIVMQESQNQYDFDKNINMFNITLHNEGTNTQRTSDDILNAQNCNIDDPQKEENSTINRITFKRCTTATSTEELLSFSSTEVQTTPYDIPESESETNDEPIENLSILTKEILNRTELQECIAENINKAILPTELSFREESLNESMGVEGNTSIMTELNNAIKSIVEATESDPVFEKFLDEVIGPHIETDTSPDEDGEGKLSPKSRNEIQEKQIETVLNNINPSEPMIADNKTSIENDTADVPLKQRLRSSSRQQNNRIEDEIDKGRDQEKEQNALEDQNAAAVLSIINANIINNTSSDGRTSSGAKESTVASDDNGKKIQTVIPVVNKSDASLKSITSSDVQKPNNITSSANSNIEPKVRKTAVKRPRPTRPKRDQVISSDEYITEKEIMTMPTLVVCSKEEINNLLTINSSTIKSSSTSHFIPIAPKNPNRLKESVETLYLRTVNVAHKVPINRSIPTMLEELNNSTDRDITQSQKKNSKMSKRLKTTHETDVAVPLNASQQTLNPIESVQINKIVEGDSITLYGNENSVKSSLDSTCVPIINLDENISLSESGLSPYLKFNCNKTNQNHNLSDIDLASIMESTKVIEIKNDTNKQFPTICNSTECDIITKRTPRSLLKSRSKNHRLSLSTPRKRNSHIRALDFSTPTKINSNKKVNRSGNTQFSSASTKHLKSVCRTSLFLSPSYSNCSVVAQKQKSPTKVCQSYKIPIATRSPTPKLMGGWDKYNGVGVIIDDMSVHGNASTSCDKIQHESSKTLAKSWDADLRKIIQLNEKDENVSKGSVKERNSIKHKNNTTHQKNQYNSRSAKNSTKKKVPKTNKISNQDMLDTNKMEENIQEDTKISSTEKNPHVIQMNENLRNNEKEQIEKDTNNFNTNKTHKVPELTDNQEIPIKLGNTIEPNNLVTEKKPVKKYVQLKTIKTNLKELNSEDKKDLENPQTNSQMSELKISTNSTQHFLRMSDMVDLETPRKFNNISGIPPTPRVLSPSSNIITPFIKLSEDSSKICNFISTPEFPITPCIALTPRLNEETTRDNIRKDDYDYYKPTSEQIESSDKISKPKDNMQKSSVISSSHMKLQSTHDSLTPNNTYQTCTASKLEITQFEVIKENLPKEDAIKELKITTNSKDSVSATERDTPVVTDRQVDLIQINDIKSTNKHCETIINDNYVSNFQNDNDSGGNDSSSSSDTSSSSSSSSSSSTSSSPNTDSSACSPNTKCDEASNKTCVDISNDSAQKSTNIHENTGAVTNDISANMQTNTYEDLNNPSTEIESSPKKIFTIMKNDDQIKATSKETPAKDETLLNEADISETPSGSKSGVENLTNLSTKISAIIMEDEKLSSNSLKDCDKTVNRLRSKPKIIDVQYIRPESSKVIDSVKSIQQKRQSALGQSTTVYNKLVAQLQEKRQRIITKFRDIPKSNLAHITKHKRVLVDKTSNNLKRNNKSVKEQQKHIRSMTNCSRKTKINKNDNKKNDDNAKISPVINTRKRCEIQKQNSINKSYNKKDMRNRITRSENTDTNLSSNKTLNDHTTKQPYKNKKETNLAENKELNSLIQSHENSSLEGQEYLKTKLDAKTKTEQNCGVKRNIEKEEVKRTIKDNNTHTKISKVDINTTENDIIVKETSDKVKQEVYEQAENKVNKSKQFTNHTNKSKNILKCKVDQIKRDLFSDEENDQKTSWLLAKNKIQRTANLQTQNSVFTEVPIAKENTTVENPKEDLSTVLQCLQLVPAYKNEYVNEDENQTEKQQQEQNEHKNKVGTDNKSNQTANNHNYKAEYHFVYDDSTPVRKRRRRYSGHELQIEINYADLSDPNSVECIKIMKATEFEEIFNFPPKTRKRALNKKPPIKIEKDCETHNFRTNETAVSKNNIIEPLASSSPIDNSSDSKLKRTATAANKTDCNMQSDTKKKQKLDKIHEKVSDVTVKHRKRKLSETKETKQIEKKPCTADPQILLSNLDLDKFLTTVHGPE